MYFTLDYNELVEAAMRHVIRYLLQKLAKQELPASHYFHVGFATKASGVELPGYLLEKYPSEISIVLQNQFKALEVEMEAFKVTLTFQGKEERLRIPFCAITSFLDPSTNFHFNFKPDEIGLEGYGPFYDICNDKKEVKPLPEEVNNISAFVDEQKMLES